MKWDGQETETQGTHLYNNGGIKIVNVILCPVDKQEAFEKCCAHSPLRAAARRLFYIAIHQVSLLSHTANVARRLRINVHNNIDNA